MRTTAAPAKPRKGEPAWAIAELFPPQGYWDEGEYLGLGTNRLVEFDDGFIEVLSVPTTSHQMILAFLFEMVSAFVKPQRLGKVAFAGIRVRLWARKYRQPDLVFMLTKHVSRVGEEFWKGADLVMEVVSKDEKDRHRDLVEKRREYAKGRIPEYWIVDPERAEIVVLQLAGTKYVVAGTYGINAKAKSIVLKGFEVDVHEVLSQN